MLKHQVEDRGNLRADAQAYEARGLEPQAAALRAVDDRIDEVQREFDRVMDSVLSAYEQQFPGRYEDLVRAIQPSSLPAVSGGGLFVTFGGQRYPVESIEDAQRKWEQFRDASVGGVSEIGNGVEVMDGAGRVVARVAYNGRLFAGDIPGAGVIAEAPSQTPSSSIPLDSGAAGVKSESAQQEPGNAEAGNNRGDESALAGVSPGVVPGARRDGGAGSRSGSGGGTDAAGNGRAAADPQDQQPGGVAGEPGAVLPEGSSEAVADLTTAPKNPARSGDNPGNYTITDADEIGTGTPGERIRANMAAIRLVLDLEREGRYATREEQAVLVKYVGWGGLKNVFKGDNSTSKQERDAYAELKRILTSEQLFWMGQSVLDAHYTSPRVVRAMYRVLEHFGVEGGRFIEPTVGSGNFIGMMPAGMAANTRWHASEIDPLTSLIARNLYPDAQVLTATGFQNAEFAYGRFDVAIGNPPFGDQRITDTNKKRADISGFKIHNYIIAKASKHLRPGGVMAFVVTNRFMDTADAEARAYLAENFRFLGAFRLPNNAFKENAGTEVTTDVVFLQRLREGENGGSDAWLDTNGQMSNEDGESIRLNRYFAENPEMLLGKPSMQGTMYGGRGAEFTLEAIEGFDVDAAIDQLLADGKLGPAGLAKATDVDRDVQAAVVDMNREDVPIGGFFRDGDRIIQRMDDDADGNVLFRELTPDTPWTEKQTLGATRFARILGIMNLRDMAYDLMAAERGDMGTDIIEGKRQMLNERYDAFVKEFGFLNDAANRGLFDDDPRIEFGLEGNYRKGVSAAAAKRLGTGVIPPSADKSSLLRERVFFPKQEVESADTPRDGYSISLSERGRLDLDYISSLTGLSVDAVIEDLSTGDSPLIYRDPVMNKWVQEDEYLSGNVKAKLKAARGAGLEGNVRALEAVQPADVAPDLIHVEFGATWVPAEVYEDFLGLLGYANPQVAVLPLSGSVEATRVGNLGPSAFRADLENQDYTIADLFSMVANRRKLVAYDGRGDERVVNQQRTDNLGRIRKKLLAIWSDWVKADPERADKLALVYNETMNTTIERKYDGVRHLRTVGTNPVYRLRNSQKNSAWRMIQSSIVMMDHVVGAGKTMALTTGIMERKRLGLSKKPMVAVPNHLVGQWARDWLALYPGANILAATEKDFSKPNRRRLFARIATGKFDAIIVGHTSLGFIPLSPETKTKFVMLEVEHLEKALSEAKSAQKGEKKESRQVRAIKNRIAKRQEKIKELQDRTRDNVASFEDMGIDYLAVDEFHEFKNLEYATTLSNVAGMGSPEGSKKAFDLYMKIRVLQEAGGGIAGATGTPLSNSMVEMYTLLRYLNPGALERAGMEQFDSWVKAFASIDQRDEYTASGNIKARTVMAAFNNLPELLQMYKQVADTVTMTDLKRIYAEQVREENQRRGESNREDFPVPKVAGGARQLDMGAPTPDQTEFMDYLIARADVLDKLKGKAKQEYAKTDNALWLMNDARKMSLDVRIIDPTVEDHPDNKVNRAARRIKSIYDKWDADLGTQLVFCDLSTPAKTAEKAAREFIRDAVKKLGFAGDKAIEAMLEDKLYVDQWRMLETRADMMLDGGRLSDAERERVELFMEGVGDDERSALVVADSKFSVYDALKQKLMDAGIPESEIAFIHDANTSERKRELFDLVNAGKVRVLAGSSMKMGAGTNAQKRLVALHHMDAPWRPSDMEQREGRIIRQGNMLYERDPDGFEVEIVAYSTERTFDAQMWGVLARKAGFLEQFRMGLRSIREEGGDADGYAEFMAEATGNQIFRDKIRLERELDDLEAEERSAKMKRQAAENLVISADSKLDRLNRELEEVTRLAGADFSSITFEGKTYRNDLAEAIEAEEARFRTLMAAYEVEHDAYKVARKAWEEAAGTDRGRPPPKPVAPEQPELTSPSFREVSEWARFIDAITKKIELISGDAAVRTFEVTAANGVVVPVQAKRYGDTDVQIRISPYDSWSWAEPARSPKIAGGLTPRQFQSDLRGLPIWTERSISDLTSAVEQSRLTLDRVKPVDPETVTAKRAEYEAVKKAVEDANAVLAAERAQRDNRFIAKDTRRFGAGLKALGELRQERQAAEPAEAAPKLPPIPAGARFRQLRQGDNITAEYVEKPTDIPMAGLEDVTFFASKREATGTWSVNESSTGLTIGGNEHETRKAAIEAALQVVSNMGPEKVRAAIEKGGKLTDDQKRAAMKKAGVEQGPADDIRASVRSTPLDNTNKRTAFFTALAKFDEAFQQPTPKSKTVEAIAREIDPGYQAKELPAALARAKTRGRAVRMWEIGVPKSGIRSGYLYEDATGRVWIDVSRLKPDVDSGSKIYGIAAGYAHNAGKVFIGDPEGLSPVAFFRRLENMISSALRYGTTDHLYPHGAQVSPGAYYAADYPDFGKAVSDLGLDWKDGDFAHNLSQMLQVSYNAAVRNAAKIKDIVYDFDSRQFVDAVSGERRDRDSFGDLLDGQESGAPTRYRGGGATLARAALFNTLVRGQGKEAWAKSVAAIGEQLRGRGIDFELNGIFYSVPSTPAASTFSPAKVRAALVKRFGESGIASLESSGVLQIVPSWDDLPARIRTQGEPDGRAFYDGQQGTAYLIADRLDAGSAASVLLHEIGEHYGLRNMLGDTGYRALVAKVRAMATKPDSIARMAWNNVKGAYQEFKGRADSDLAADERFMSEVVARLGEEAAFTETSFWRDLKSMIQRFLLKIGIPVSLDEFDVMALVEGSLKYAMRTTGGPAPRGGMEPAFAKAKAASGNERAQASVVTGLRDFMESSDVGRKVSDKVADMFHSQKTFNWWHRTVGSQYHKAQVDKDFRGVFTLAQDYLDDVSKFAKEASDRAGRLLPQMEQVQDAVSGMFSMRRDAADAAAIAGPVFQGTLTDKVWTDAELRNPPMDPLTREPIFPALTDLQIELYKEFRAATDKSLDDLAVSEMARLAKASRLEVAPLGMSLRETAQFYYDQFGAQLETLEIQRGELTKTHAGERRLLEAAATDLPEGSAGRSEYLEQVDQMRKRQGAERTALDQELAGLDVLRSGFLDKAAKISRLKANGYAPLMRFGQYTIDVFMQATDPVTGAPQVNDKGEPVVVKDSEGEPIRPFFGMFESESEANEAARMLAEDYPDYTIQRGILSQNAYELFKGVTPETVELFGQMIGAENEQAFQSYLKLAVNNRSAMKRLIQRKGMAGFAKDPARVLASFILSNARAASGNWHFGDMMQAAAAIPKTKGDVKDEAVRLLSYVQNPQEEASAVRGLLFAQFLGGSIAAAMVNMTQSFTTTFPYLSQFGDGAVSAVADAMKMAAKLSVLKKWQVPDAGLRSALEQATEEGVVSPHEVHLLMGQANPTSAFGNSRLLRNVTRVWGSFFSLAERYNRHVAFIAAWNMAQKQGMSPEAAYAFAKQAVTETQFLYSKVNRPNWARGPVGAVLFTFKTFLVNYMEFLRRLPAKERAIALAVLVVASGLSGLPGADDLDDLLDTIGQALGFDTNFKQTKVDFATRWLGRDAAGFLLQGVSYGIPFDVSARLGMGNLVPGTGMFKKSEMNKSGEILEAVGPVGGLAQSVSRAFETASSGEVLRGGKELLPKAIKDGVKAVDMYQTGVYKDYRGRKVVDVDGVDAFVKAIGFNPNEVAEVQRAKYRLQDSVNLARVVESDIAEKWARGLHERDPDAVRNAQQKLRDWNSKNPETPIRIKFSQVQRRVVEMTRTSADRLVRATPKEMRGMVREGMGQ